MPLISHKWCSFLHVRELTLRYTGIQKALRPSIHCYLSFSKINYREKSNSPWRSRVDLCFFHNSINKYLGYQTSVSIVMIQDFSEDLRSNESDIFRSQTVN